MDGIWRFALSSSSESWRLSDVAATFNAQQRPGKLRMMELVVGKHNDKSERHQITALSRGKMFPFSQLKQFVPKAVSLKRRVLMPNTKENT